MYVYLGMIAIMLLLRITKLDKKKWALPLMIAMFTVVAAARWNVGYDYSLYAHNYYFYGGYFDKGIGNLPYEQGWVAFYKLIQMFSPASYKPMFIVYSLILYPIIGYCIWRDSKDFWLSCFMFMMCGIFYNSLCFMRQMLAAVIVLYAFKYIKEKSFNKYLVYILFASTFHISALIMIPVYFILKIRLKWWIVVPYLVILFAIYYNSFELMESIGKYIYPSYAFGTSQYSEVIMGLPKWYAIPTVVVLASTVPFYNELVDDNVMNKYYVNCLLGALSFMVLSWHHAVVSRPGLYFFIPGLCLYVPIVYEMYKAKILCKVNGTKGKYILLIISLVLFVLLSVYQVCLLKNNYSGVVPYMTYADEFVEGAD